MKDKRPKNLNLFTIHFPIPAIVSILHRITGVFLFLLIPIIILGLNLSLESQQSYDRLTFYLSMPFIKILLLACLAMFIFHLFAGLRHVLMDMGIGESLQGGRLGAQLTVLFSLVSIIFIGLWLW